MPRHKEILTAIFDADRTLKLSESLWEEILFYMTIPPEEVLKAKVMAGELNTRELINKEIDKEFDDDVIRQNALATVVEMNARGHLLSGAGLFQVLEKTDLFREGQIRKLSEQPFTMDIYTDGACSGNPGPGGWGVLIRTPDDDHEASGSHPATTNQEMELLAALKGLQLFQDKFHVADIRPRIVSDSQYVVKGMAEWADKWDANGWRTSSKKPVAHLELWQQVLRKKRQLKAESLWVAGHSGNEGNERVDALASAAAKSAKESNDEGRPSEDALPSHAVPEPKPYESSDVPTGPISENDVVCTAGDLMAYASHWQLKAPSDEFVLSTIQTMRRASELLTTMMGELKAADIMHERQDRKSVV